MARNANNSFRETIAPTALFLGDTLATFAGLSIGFWLRYASPLSRLGLEVPNARFADYSALLSLGGVLLIGAFANLGLYDSRMLLRRYQSLNIIIKGAAFWFFAYLGVSLVLKFNPPISRLFVALAFTTVLALLYIWRSVAYAILASARFRPRLQRRTALLGWNENAEKLCADLSRDTGHHPFLLMGVIALPGETPPAAIRHLGESAQLETILTEESIDLLIATRLDLPRLELQRIVELCERAYIEWKIVPASFDIFLNGLRLQTVGRLPVLGIEALAITKLFNRCLKRLVDLCGAAIGLTVSAPLVAVLAYLIKRESPGTSVFFGQLRVGEGHSTFTLYKLRSMRPEAASRDHEQQSTPRNDPRLLRVGAFMRKWNLDELPQFWNVLRGEMSLVGPRPERPYHVDQLAGEIPHYLPRHLVLPGMTGWAQINGLRGDSSIALRIQYDIYYIENWSLPLDFQILLLTFVRWKNAY